ncbi:hypothetical protein PR048_025806 [Dryococelus australis]|uniref:Uncharacterized protein n=1 Tax=Dryococelus australis TaxID=614101 RepID=A0ABQ9GJK9_9NEOP|nr:hypothetical protein PR048_025806 [Dryococelus australis]
MFVILIHVLSCRRDPSVFVGAVKELPSEMGAECSRVILSTVSEYDIQYENVVRIVSDSENICELFHFVELNQCIRNNKYAFLNVRKMKHRFVKFLKQNYPNEEKNHYWFLYRLWQDFCNMGLKCHAKLTVLVNYDAGKDFVFNIGKPFHPKYVMNNMVDDSLSTNAKKVPFLSKLSQHTFFEGFLAFQSQVLELLSEIKPVDVVKVSLGLREQHSNFVEQSVSIVDSTLPMLTVKDHFLHIATVLQI